MLRRAAQPLADALTRSWPPYSRLFLVGEGAGWVIDHELRAVAGCAATLGIKVANPRLVRASRRQAAFYGSQFTLLTGRWSPPPHRLGVAYFHGRPGTPGMPEFDECYRTLCAHHEELARVQVSHRELEEIVLASGIEREKVHLIPIGIDPALFTPQTPELRAECRAALGLSAEAFVVGSFHKDGIGWDDGLEPKAIKGPDVLVETLRLVRESVSELAVVLSGPARGFVCGELERHGIEFVHRRLDRYEQVGALYHALDAYVVPSRQEGGPKGVLEAMASGIPLVSTRVGQATDLVRDGENGWLVDVEDAEGLARALVHVARRPDTLRSVVKAGLATAAANTYTAQLPLWRDLFDGFVEPR